MVRTRRSSQTPASQSDAIVLAGGLGTRLSTVLSDVPKVLAPVAGRAFLEYLLVLLRTQGFRDLTLAVGHMAGQVQAAFGAGRSLGLHLRYSREDEPLGTGGALRLALDLTHSGNIIALNGYPYFAVYFTQLAYFHIRYQAVATVALARVAECARYGAVSVDEGCRITAFREKGETGSSIINGGVYVFARGTIEHIPPSRRVSLEQETLPALVGHGLYGAVFDEYFTDIGTPEAYAEACRNPGRLISSVAGGH